MNSTKLVTMKKASEMLGVHRNTLTRMVKQGAVKAVKIPDAKRNTFVALCEIEKLINGKKGA